MHGTRFGLILLVLWAAAAQGSDLGRHLDDIRARLRAEAGVRSAPARGDDLPMVALTVLPGDTHARLAAELTGSREAEPVLRKIEPRLEPGQKVYVPRALLTPSFADPRLEGLTLGKAYPTLWRLTVEGTRMGGDGPAVAVRNLQRLNGIVDPTRLPAGARVLVPRSLLATAPVEGPERFRVRTGYQVSDLKGLERRLAPDEIPSALRRSLERSRQWARQRGPREPDLVVLHTTEHRGAPFDNVARYLQRKRLANYVVGPDGAVYRVVPESHRSYGCGQSLWEGRYAVDHEAINVEIYADTAPGTGGKGIRAAQYEGLRKLLADIRARRPAIHEGRVVTHRMVAVSYRFGTRSRKGDPYAFDWARAGLPDNSRVIDQDVLLGRAKMCTDERYSDRVTPGQTAANRFLRAL